MTEKRRIKKDDLLGRYYDITLSNGRRLRFKADRIENDETIHGENEEQERWVILPGQISSISRQGVSYELERPACYGLEDWTRDSMARDRLLGTNLTEKILDRLKKDE